jgi:hypothetical protein
MRKRRFAFCTGLGAKERKKLEKNKLGCRKVSNI